MGSKEQIGKILKKAKENTNLTQEQVAEKRVSMLTITPELNAVKQLRQLKD